MTNKQNEKSNTTPKAMLITEPKLIAIIQEIQQCNGFALALYMREGLHRYHQNPLKPVNADTYRSMRRQYRRVARFLQLLESY